MESFHANLKKEHIYQRPLYTSFEEAKLDIFRYIYGFYNTRRIHSSLGYLTPLEFEQQQ